MLKTSGFFAWFLIIAGCIEPYEFVIRDSTPSLVVEGYISDKSLSETLQYPSDGRYFTVKLSQTGDVTNARPNPVNSATVELFASDGERWTYTAGPGGVYTLFQNDFKAQRGVAYKLRIRLPDENAYESAWEEMPYTDIPPIGEVGFGEGEKQVYVMEASEWVLRTKQIATVNIEVPENNSEETIHYRWTYSPTWIYVAPLNPSTSDPNYRCWATDPNYLNTYSLQADHAGGYRKDLFDIFTVRNERIFEKFSVLVTQHAMTEPYFNFWKEMKAKNDGGPLTEVPPYNLKTNFTCTTDSRKVSGYFGVTSEQATRWYFDMKDLSYDIENTLRGDCLVVYGPDGPAPECFDCRQYSYGNATNEKPGWWIY